MQKRPVRRQSDPGGSSDGVGFKICFSVLQCPWWMMNFSAIDLAAMDCVQAIALGQPILKRSSVALSYSAAGPIIPAKLCASTSPPGKVVNIPTKFL